MDKLIVFQESDFKNKFFVFLDNFIELSKKDYGAKLYSNASKQIVTDESYVRGILCQLWLQTFGAIE